MKRRKQTRLEELNEFAKSAGLFVCTYSPGDGVTRYRFFELARANPRTQDYFGPANGVHTALGLKKAWDYLQESDS